MSANSSRRNRFTTTVAQELLVGVTGIVLVLFILGHLLGNLLLYAGPEAFNAYAHKLASLGPLLWVIRLGLIAAFLAHVCTAAWLFLGGRSARGAPYGAKRPVAERAAKLLMITSGLLIFLFLILHLSDFTFGEKEGPGTRVAGMWGGEELGLFGLVWNSFAKNIARSVVYILAVSAVGFHLSHALYSVLATLGVLSDKATPKAKLAAYFVGAVVALGFASIPVWVLVKTYLIGVQA